MNKLNWRAATMVACVALVGVCGVARAEVPLVTGETWMKSSEEVKKAYLVGLANLMQVEYTYQSSNPPTDAQSLVPRAEKGMKNHTLDTENPVRTGVPHSMRSTPSPVSLRSPR